MERKSEPEQGGLSKGEMGLSLLASFCISIRRELRDVLPLK